MPYTTDDIVSLSFNQKPIGVSQAVDSILRSKIQDKLQEFEDFVRPSLFDTDNEDEEQYDETEEVLDTDEEPTNEEA